MPGTAWRRDSFSLLRLLENSEHELNSFVLIRFFNSFAIFDLVIDEAQSPRFRPALDAIHSAHRLRFAVAEEILLA